MSEQHNNRDDGSNTKKASREVIKGYSLIGLLLLITMAFHHPTLTTYQSIARDQILDETAPPVTEPPVAEPPVTEPLVATVQQETAKSHHQPDLLPSCKTIMQAKGSPFRDGSFLTRHSAPISWVPRVDGSRELRHSMCTLHRYTADEARQCLAKRHVHMIGDSLTRYQYLSLVWFMHKGQYPPRFGHKKPCPHIDENGKEMCSPLNEPNICMEGEWRRVTPRGKFSFMQLMQTVGSTMFDGYMEASAARDANFIDKNIVENYLYVAPPTDHDSNSSTIQEGRPIVSYAKEIGWAGTPTNINGFNFTDCAFQGTCNFTDAMARERQVRAKNMDFDFDEPIIDALKPNGVLSQQLPQVDIAIYNRGYWGKLNKEKANKIMPALHSFSQGPKGRCFFRATMAAGNLVEHERQHVRDAAWSAGCGYLDFGHLVEDFTAIHRGKGRPPDQEYGNNRDELEYIYWDTAHFMPWVNEELNNMLLNVLCNSHTP